MLGKIWLGVLLALGVTSVANAYDTHRSHSSIAQYGLLAATPEGCFEPQFIVAQPGVVGQPFAFSDDVECLPTGEEFSHPVIAWGDGTTSPGTIGTVNRERAFSSVEVSGQHVYSGSGVFCIKVDVTDNDTGQTFTGAWHTCAEISFPGAVPVVPPPAAPPSAPTPPPAAPTLSSLSETTGAWREGNVVAHGNPEDKTVKPPLGTIFSFILNEAASVTFTFSESFNGRKVGKTCAAKTNKNRHKRRCTLSVSAGTWTFSARAGTNKVRFEGLISKRKKLRPGRYTLLITATSAAGQRAQPKSLSFTILK